MGLRDETNESQRTQRPQSNIDSSAGKYLDIETLCFCARYVLCG